MVPSRCRARTDDTNRAAKIAPPHNMRSPRPSGLQLLKKKKTSACGSCAAHDSSHASLYSRYGLRVTQHKCNIRMRRERETTEPLLLLGRIVRQRTTTDNGVDASHAQQFLSCDVVKNTHAKDDLQLCWRRDPRCPTCAQQLSCHASDINSVTDVLLRLTAGVLRAFGRVLPTRCGVIAADDMHVVVHERHTVSTKQAPSQHNKTNMQHNIQSAKSLNLSKQNRHYQNSSRFVLLLPFLDRGFADHPKYMRTCSSCKKQHRKAHREDVHKTRRRSSLFPTSKTPTMCCYSPESFVHGCSIHNNCSFLFSAFHVDVGVLQVSIRQACAHA